MSQPFPETSTETPPTSPRPVVSVNFAISADGKISSVERQPSGWTSARDHQRLKELRRGKDALMVGRETLEKDRMTLTADDGDQPWRCVVSRIGKFDSTQPLFHTPGGPVHLLASDWPDAPPPDTVAHTGDLAGFLKALGEAGIRTLHCEGGGEVVAELARLDAIDIIHLTWAGHTLFGGRQAPTVTGVPGEFLPASREYELVEFDPDPEAGECFLTYRRKIGG